MPTLSEQRPDPDLLLAKVKRQEAEARRGKLRIYFGSSAGVGKTYAMLAAARKLKQEGRDVLVGIVETHGRAETAALLVDLPSLPPKSIPYRGKDLSEFDLDAALLRAPSLILVDELAHSNVQGRTPPEALAGRRGAAGGRHRRIHHAECAAFGKPQRRGRRDHQCAGVGDRAGYGVRRCRGGGAGRHPGRGTAGAVEGRQGVRAAPSGAGGEQFLSQGQFDGSAGAGAAPHRRPRRGRCSSLPGRQIDRLRLENRQCAADLRGARRGRGASGAGGGAPRRAAERRVACHLRGNARIAAPAGGAARENSRDAESGARNWAQPPR